MRILSNIHARTTLGAHGNHRLAMEAFLQQSVEAFSEIQFANEINNRA